MPENVDNLTRNAEQLKSTVKEQLSQLGGQNAKIIAFQSKLGILLRGYNLNQSYFNYTATWFGKLYWWQKIGLGLALVVVVGLIAALFNAVALAVTIASMISLAAAFFLINHYHTIKQQEQRFTDSIASLEKDSKALCQVLQQLNEQLTTAIDLMHQQIHDLIADSTLRKQQAQQLNDDLKQFKLTITHLQSEKDDLEKTHQQLNQQFGLTNQQLKTIEDTLVQKINSLAQLSNELLATKNSLQQSHASLLQIETDHQQELTTLRELCSSLNEKLTILQEKITEEDHVSTELMTDLASADKVIANMDKAMAAAAKAIAESNPAVGRSDIPVGTKPVQNREPWLDPFPVSTQQFDTLAPTHTPS